MPLFKFLSFRKLDFAPTSPVWLGKWRMPRVERIHFNISPHAGEPPILKLFFFCFEFFFWLLHFSKKVFFKTNLSIKMRSFLLTVLVGLFFVSVAFTFDQKRDCKCRSTVSKRIINGKWLESLVRSSDQTNRNSLLGRIADQASYPWQISINMKDSFPLPDILRRLVPNRIKLEKHKWDFLTWKFLNF